MAESAKKRRERLLGTVVAIVDSGDCDYGIHLLEELIKYEVRRAPARPKTAELSAKLLKLEEAFARLAEGFCHARDVHESRIAKPYDATWSSPYPASYGRLCATVRSILIEVGCLDAEEERKRDAEELRKLGISVAQLGGASCTEKTGGE